ncbi:MAG: pyruvate kinase [Chloroflexi bacterium]|nr:pyruvate kinase [Chloroflexota bacterium]
MSVAQDRINGKRTKIVATIGPASRDEEILRQLIRNGMNVARINFSHGTHELHGETIDRIRKIAVEEKAVVAVMCDLQGPKIRIGKVANEPLLLEKGDTITFTLDPVPGENGLISLPHPEFVRDIKAGMQLLLDDGNIELVVEQVTNRGLVTKVVVGGPLSSRKGISAPTARLSLSAITEKDRKDVEFALAKQADYLAMSFVRSQEDIRELRWLLRHLGGEIAVISKIEKHEALENIEEIIAVSDGIMVARGDLGVETPAEEVPFHQKRIIQLCNAAGKPVITATQMLSSMVDNPRPTRAEASDVYNAIVDGTDAVMLSNETAAGKYPVEAVKTMATIAVIAEQSVWANRPQLIKPIYKPNAEGREAISDAISQATCQIAEALNSKAIVTSTLTGYTTRRVAKERPRTPILCVTPSEITYRRMALVWGVLPLVIPEFHTIDEMIRTVVQAAQDADLVSRGDNLVLIAGVPFGVGGQTNFLKIHTVGETVDI